MLINVIKVVICKSKTISNFFRNYRLFTLVNLLAFLTHIFKKYELFIALGLSVCPDFLQIFTAKQHNLATNFFGEH